jgi:hypothetical protein
MRSKRKAGYKNAKAWFSQHLVDLSQPALKMYGAVAEAFSEEVARRFGVTCLSLLLTYEEAADMEANHEELGPTLIEALTGELPPVPEVRVVEKLVPLA